MQGSSRRTEVSYINNRSQNVHAKHLDIKQHMTTTWVKKNQQTEAHFEDNKKENTICQICVSSRKAMF